MITLDVRTLRDRVGQEIAVGTWTTISQAQIDQFAEATGDRQWIHVDAARTKAESPFKTTIAHGFLTLSLLSAFLREAIEFYGLNKVRFVAPVVSGSRVRARIVAGAFEEVAGGAIQVTWAIAVERENSEKPACVAEWIVRYYPSGD